MAFIGSTPPARVFFFVLFSFSGSCFRGQLCDYQSHTKAQREQTLGKERTVISSGMANDSTTIISEESVIATSEKCMFSWTSITTPWTRDKSSGSSSRRRSKDTRVLMPLLETWMLKIKIEDIFERIRTTPAHYYWHIPYSSRNTDTLQILKCTRSIKVKSTLLVSLKDCSACVMRCVICLSCMICIGVDVGKVCKDAKINKY